MTNTTRPTRTTNIAHHQRIAGVVPDTTPPTRLHQLQARYEDLRDPLIAALPVTYREAVTYRLRALLAAAPVLEPAQ